MLDCILNGYHRRPEDLLTEEEREGVQTKRRESLNIRSAARPLDSRKFAHRML